MVPSAERLRYLLKRADVCRHFQALSGAGLDPNTAAAYSLKWTSKTAEPVDIQGLPQQAAPRASEDGISAAHSSGQLPAQAEQQLLRLFSSGDALYLTLVLHFRRPQPAPQVRHQQATHLLQVQFACSSGSMPMVVAAWLKLAQVHCVPC